jgi:hypothetical protein
MSIDRRLTRLRALVDRLERLPASNPRRPWMLSDTRARVVDVETGEAPRAMRPLAADLPPRSAEQAPRSTARPEPLERAVGQRSQRPTPDSKTPHEPGRINPNSSANGRAAPGSSVDASDREHTVIARPGATTDPLDMADVLWAEDSQAEVSPAAPARDGDADPRPWRRGLRG